MDETSRDFAKANGWAVKKAEKGSGWSTSNPQVVELAARWVAEQHADKKPDAIFRFARGRAEQREMVRAAHAAECMAAAGHPYEPTMKFLDGENKKGVWLDKIDVKFALSACRAAQGPNAGAAVRYALARVHQAAKNDEATREITEELMKKEYPLAYVMAADAYANGRWGPKDIPLARATLERGAGKGHTLLLYYLGYFEMKNILGAPRMDVARRSLLAAHKRGFEYADVLLAELYAKGLGGSKRPEEAAKLYEAAANRNDVAAQREAGIAYYHGRGVKEDRKKAFRFLKKAADAEDATAAYYTGFMLARGQGATKNAKSAVQYFRVAHKANIRAATAELGRMTYRGEGVTANQTEGRRLLKIAADAGNAYAKEYLEQISDPLAGKTVPEQHRSDMQKLARSEKIRLTRASIPFMSGLASNLMQSCGYPSDISLRTEMMAFIARSAIGGAAGSDYSNPNLGAAVGSMMQTNTMMAAGGRLGKELGCNPVSSRIATGIAQAIRADSRGADGGLSTFVKSCTPHFDQRRCTCLANAGRTVIPDIHRQRYHRDLVYNIIQRNPFVGMTIPLTCGIVNY